MEKSYSATIKSTIREILNLSSGNMLTIGTRYPKMKRVAQWMLGLMLQI
jgi:hypothetical protein